MSISHHYSTTTSQPVTVTLVNCSTCTDNPCVSQKPQLDNHISQLSTSYQCIATRTATAAVQTQPTMSQATLPPVSLSVNGGVPNLIIAHISKRHRMFIYRHLYTTPRQNLGLHFKINNFLNIKSHNIVNLHSNHICIKEFTSTRTRTIHKK